MAIKPLGHYVTTHKQKYRLHAPAVEITKVGRLLLAIDGGNVTAYSGKQSNSLPVVAGDSDVSVQHSSVRKRRRRHGSQRDMAIPVGKSPQRKSSGPRTKWSQAELDLLLEKFGDLRRPPNFSKIRKVRRLMPSLHDRTLPQIKTRAWALVSKIWAK